MGDGDGYNVGAISERSRYQFEHMLNIGGEEDVGFGPSESFALDNYYDLDVLAYRYRDMTYKEEILGYYCNETTYFGLIY